jgi:hypothetical protein
MDKLSIVRGWSMLVFAGLSACSQPVETPAPQMNVCEAATAAIGRTIEVSGEFGGFGYATKSRSISLLSDGTCTDRGAGIVYVELRNDTERGKVLNARPRPKRSQGSGDRVRVRGTVQKIEDGRFVTLQNGSVR